MRCRYSARELGGATELEEAGRGEDARRMAKACAVVDSEGDAGVCVERA
jgi:hypothetical protein